MQFRTEPRKLPAVLSVEEVSDLLTVAPGPGLKYRAALSLSYGAGLRASEVCNLTTGDIDSDRMLIHVDEGKGRKDRKVMLSPDLLDLLRDYWCEARPEGWLFPIARQAIAKQSAERGQAQDQPGLLAAIEPGLHIGQAYGGDHQARDPAYPAAQLCHPSYGSWNGCPGDLLPGSRYAVSMRGQVLLGHAKLSTTARYTQVATKTIRDTPSPFDALKTLHGRSLRQGPR